MNETEYKAAKAAQTAGTETPEQRRLIEDHERAARNPAAPAPAAPVPTQEQKRPDFNRDRK